MITRERIETLATFDARGARVLSLLLDLDPARQIRRSYLIAFDDLVKEARERLEQPAREAFLREAARVRTWLENEKPRGKGLALFSCEPRDLWQAHFLQIRLEDHLEFGPAPDVAPLIEVMDEYESYALALVDKVKARLFVVFMGEIEETDAFEDLMTSERDRSGGAQVRSQGHREAHIHRHLKRVAQRLSELLGRRRFDRLIVAGPEETTSDLRRILPRPLAHRLVAVIPAEMFASAHDLLQKTLPIERRVEREVEERVVGELLEMAGGGGRASLGLAPTLDALSRGEVQTLVVADELRLDGAECPECGRLDPEKIATCPECGAVTRPVRDLLHRAMRLAVEKSGAVEVVRGDAARRLVESGGGIGALLRSR